MNFHYPCAASVQLIGDWNEWGGLTGASGIIDPRAGAMTLLEGYWQGSLPDGLARGRYRYAFLVNGSEFCVDPLNPVAADFMGHRVSVLIID